MYSKTGLSALAIAGTTFGVIGMLIGAGGAAPVDCRAPSSGVSAPAIGNSADAHSTPTTPSSGDKTTTTKPGTKGTKPGTAKPATGSNGANGSGGSNGGNGSNNLIDVDTRTNTPDDGGLHVTVPGDGTAPSVGTDGSSSSDLPFLDLQGNTDGVATGTGTTSVPPAGLHVIGRSNPLAQLLHITGAVDTTR